jgi:hypothetical protein
MRKSEMKTLLSVVGIPCATISAPGDEPNDASKNTQNISSVDLAPKYIVALNLGNSALPWFRIIPFIR